MAGIRKLWLLGVIGIVILGIGILTFVLWRQRKPPVPVNVDIPVPTIEPTVTPSPSVTPSPTVTPTPSNTPTPTPTVIPLTFSIPKLKIETAVELAGVTATGNMDTPKNAKNVAWYMHGTVPGMAGNAVITGHYDTVTGKPAVFYTLNSLAIGDAVEISLSDGRKLAFVVTGKDLIDYKTFPAGYIFWEKPGTNLNLITCGGIWDRAARTYTKRVVIYTTLKGSAFDML